MPKIDLTKLEGYREDMTVEEKLALYESFELPEETSQKEKLDMSKFIPKELYDKKASEAATYSRKLRDKMTIDEQAELERQAAQVAMEEELNHLRREKTISAHVAKYLELGYDAALANETAEAMADGDMDRFFSNMGKAKDTLEKVFRAENVANDPAPPPGGIGKTDVDLFQQSFQEG